MIIDLRGINPRDRSAREQQAKKVGAGVELLPYCGFANRAWLLTCRLADWPFGTSASVKPLSEGPRSGRGH